MSLTSLGAQAYAIQNPAPRPPVRPGGGGYESNEEPGVPPPPPTAQPPSAAVAAIERLVAFVPTETITIFWLAVPAVQKLAERLGLAKGTWGTTADWVMYGVLLVFTPLFVLLSYYSRMAQKTGAALAGPFLAWRCVAGTLSFAFWAFAVPGNPFVPDTDGLMLAWVVAALVSTILSQIDPILAARWTPPPASPPPPKTL